MVRVDGLRPRQPPSRPAPGLRSGIPLPLPEGDGGACPVHDTADRTWRHLDFFQHQAYLHARVPRVACPAHGVRQVAVGWARPESGFTLLFEALLMALVSEMPVRAVADLVGEHDTRLWRVLHHYVELARASRSDEGVLQVGLDETSARRGHDYISIGLPGEEGRGFFQDLSLLLEDPHLAAQVSELGALHGTGGGPECPPNRVNSNPQLGPSAIHSRAHTARMRRRCWTASVEVDGFLGQQLLHSTNARHPLANRNSHGHGQYVHGDWNVHFNRVGHAMLKRLGRDPNCRGCSCARRRKRLHDIGTERAGSNPQARRSA